MSDRLEPLGQDIWFVEGPVVPFYTFPYPTRMVVVRLRNDDLWIWSPVALDGALKHEVSALGTVSHLVSPNPLHHLYLGDWKDAFPDAQLWGPPSTIKKRSDLRFDNTLADDTPEIWSDDIDQVHITGSIFMDEIVFFHRHSKTAILADFSESLDDAFLCEHWSPWRRSLARLCRIVPPWGWAPLEWRWSFLNRAKAREAAKQILAWGPEQVVVAHGPIQYTGARAYLDRAFAWLLR